MVSVIIAWTGLAWLSICSIKSTTAASIYPGDCGNIRIPYTTSANMSSTQSLLLFSMIYLSRKSHWTHSFFPFNLVMGTKTFASIFVIWANFFLNEIFFDFFQKTLFGFGGDILSRAVYSSTIGVKFLWLKVNTGKTGPKTKQWLWATVHQSLSRAIELYPRTWL